MSKSRESAKTGLLAGAVGLAKLPGIFWSFSRLGYEKRARGFAADESMVGKTVAITGANSGIGRAAAENMVRRGARVYLLCRNRERGEEACRDIQAQSNEGGSAELILVDMAHLQSVRDAAAQIDGPELSALLHNAGALHKERQLTPEGLEPDFALHLAGPHLLTKLLRPQLRACRGRVIFVSSGGMYSEKFSLAATDWESREYDGVRAYAIVKRGQVILTRLWAEAEAEIEFHAMHPGWVDTPGVETSLPRFYRRLRRWLRTPAQGADTATWLASAAALPASSGQFWLDREPVTSYLLPNTREEPGEPAKLWSALEAASG
jgi:NAD(P)-dependent dehydrogenase (short-subunit alcohol dehydrogenase family)